MIHVVTLDNFYNCVENPLAQKAFIDIARLRAAGYGAEYHASFLALGRDDFFCRHHVLYWEQNGERTAIGCYKQVLMSDCTFYLQDFPLTGSIRAVNASEHMQVMQGILEKARLEKRDVLYGGGLTIRKDFRQNPFIKTGLHDVLAALLYQDFIDFQQPLCVAAAIVRFKIERFFQKVGYQPFKLAGRELSNIPIIFAASEPAVLLETGDFLDYPKECHEKYRALMESRTLIKKTEEETQIAA